MTDIVLDPPRGAAGVLVGMRVADAERVLAALPGYVEPGRSKGSRGTAHFASGMTIQTHDDGAGGVEAVEIYRPDDPGTRVLYKGVSIFGDPAAVVEERLARHVRLDTLDEGLTVVAPDAFLALGRSVSVYGDEVHSGFFESVLVAEPGYYGDI